MINSINTNISAYYAQANIGTASDQASSSVSRLSSGNRIVKASDDVAALAAGTSLRSAVSTLKTALINTSQGASLLQVADGSLSQISDILQRQKAIAVQAGSGSLTANERGFLDQEFQALTSQIDSLVGQTNFDGVKLLNGSLSESAKVDASSAQATKASATLTFSANPDDAETVTVNGVQLSAKNTVVAGTTQFQIGTSTASTVQALADKLNNAQTDTSFTSAQKLALGQATYEASGNTLLIKARTGGTLGSTFTLDARTSASTAIDTVSEAGIGAQFGGSYVNLFGTGFTSASAAVAVSSVSSPTALNPFKGGDSLTATVGTGVSKTLYTLKTDGSDTLQSIVSGVNANAAATGISAALTYSGGTYNIRLSNSNSQDAIAINGGANFYRGTAASPATHAISGATQTINLFSDALATRVAANNTAGSPVDATSDIDSPFQNNDTISVSIGGGAKTVISAALTTGDTLAQIVDKINANANAGTLGIKAAVSGNNIAITYNDSTQTAAATFFGGTNTFGTDATGDFRNNGLNGAYNSFNLLASGLNSPDGAAAATTPSASSPIAVGNIIVKIGGTATTIAAAVNGDSLEVLAGKINANTAAKAAGIHAQIVTDGAGKYNIKLSVASSVDYASTTAPVAVTTQTDGLTDVAATTTFASGATSNTMKYRLLDTAFASHFTIGQAVVVSGNTTTAALPFSSNDVLKVNVGSGTGLVAGVQISGALTAGDTLGDIVNNINTYNGAHTTGISAALDGNGTNIILSFTPNVNNTNVNTTVNPPLSFDAGTHFYNDADSAYATPYSDHTSGLNNGYSSYKLFATDITGVGTDVVVNTGAATNAAPFSGTGATGVSVISFQIPNVASGASTALVTLSTENTLSDIADSINKSANAKQYGIHATVTTSGGNQNIVLSVADTTNAGAAVASVTITATNSAFGGASALTTATTTTYTANDAFEKAGNSSGSAANGLGGTVQQQIFGLAGGVDNGLGVASTTVVGTVGDTLLTSLAQSKPKVTITFPDVADPSASTSFGNSTYLTVGGHNFSFTTTAANSKASDEITIGATLSETLDNAVATINAYHGVGAEQYQLNQLKVTRDGNSLVIEGKSLDNVKTITGSTATATITNYTGVSASNGGSLTATTGGVITTGVSNKDFIGTINNFTATYKSSNTADLSVKVGDYTYTATGVSTNPTVDSTIRLYSDTVGGSNGGYFDVVLKGNSGNSIGNQSDANAFAQRIKAGFSTLSFYQQQNVSSYDGGNNVVVTNGTITGSLVGSKVSLQGNAFDSIKVDSVKVTAPVGSSANGQISIVLNGETYQTSPTLGNKLGSNQTYRLTSLVDGNKFLDFTTGASSIDFSTSDKAASFQAALKTAFGVNKEAAALKFQVGTTTADTLSISINNVDTNTIFAGKTLDVKTQVSAAAAANQIDSAIQAVTGVRASVGALQSRFNFATANINSSIQNQDAARGVLLDTDVAAESTAYATAKVKLEAGISVLAQANQLPQSLLKLLS